jgi:hypothetical protein
MHGHRTRTCGAGQACLRPDDGEWPHCNLHSARRPKPGQAASGCGPSNQMLSEVLRAGRASTAGLSPLSTPDSILMRYRKRLRRSVASGAGLVFQDNRNPHVYRHLQELYILNIHFPLSLTGERYPRYSLPTSVGNNCCDGFFLTVTTGRSFCAEQSLKIAPFLRQITPY